MTAPEKSAITNHIWNGNFATWEEAARAAQAGRGESAFDSVRWLDRITRQLRDYREEYLRFGIAPPPRPCNLPIVCATTLPSSIIDLGGSSGWCWDYLRNCLPENLVSSYVIVELEPVVRYMGGSGLHDHVVKYQMQDEPLVPCDLLYSNSALQYFQSNAPLLSLIERTSPKFVFLEDVIAKGQADFFTTQAYYDSAVPYRFLGLQNLLDDLSEHGYSEMVRSPYNSPVMGVSKPLPMENFAEQLQLRYPLSILLKRMQDQ